MVDWMLEHIEIIGLDTSEIWALQTITEFEENRRKSNKIGHKNRRKSNKNNSKRIELRHKRTNYFAENLKKQKNEHFWTGHT